MFYSRFCCLEESIGVCKGVECFCDNLMEVEQSVEVYIGGFIRNLWVMKSKDSLPMDTYQLDWSG